MKIPQTATPEEIVRTLALQNRGTQNFFTRDRLVELAEKRGMKIPENAKKSGLYDLVAQAYSLEEIEQIGGIGLPSKDWKQRFDITNYQLQRLAKMGMIRITGKERFYAFGAYRYANLYSVIDFCQLSADEIHSALDLKKEEHNG